MAKRKDDAVEQKLREVTSDQLADALAEAYAEADAIEAEWERRQLP